MEAISKAYHSAKTGYVGQSALYDKLQGKYTHKQINEFFDKDNTANSFRKLGKKPSLAPIMVQEPFALWELDLMDLSQPHNADGAAKYVMVVVDDFTKYVWVRAMVSKDTANFGEALHSILRESKKLPKAIMSDGEPAIKSGDIKQMFSINTIKWVNREKIHSPTVERMIRTIRGKMERAFIDQGNRKWAKIVQNIAKNINATPNEKTGVCPNDALKYKDDIWFRENIAYHEALSKIEPNKVDVGDSVKVAVRNFMQKGSKPSWSVKSYKVIEKKFNTLTLEDGEKVRSNNVVVV